MLRVVKYNTPRDSGFRAWTSEHCEIPKNQLFIWVSYCQCMIAALIVRMDNGYVYTYIYRSNAMLEVNIHDDRVFDKLRVGDSDHDKIRYGYTSVEPRQVSKPCLAIQYTGILE
jgi:hypothetical protein